MRVVGLDFALTCSGLAVADGRTLTGLRLRPRPVGHERLRWLEDRILQEVVGAELVVMEAISFGHFDKGKALAGGWWIIRHALWENGYEVATVPPASLKKYVTGKGNADKAMVLTAINGDRFPSAWAPDHDSADACGLAAMGARYLGKPIDLVPLEDQGTMLKCDWPGSTLDANFAR
jgi:crossover junction endodeoxyribonuclease RuvC